MIGAFLVLLVKPLLPYALAFAAGAMIFVVVEELIPEAQRGDAGQRLVVGGLLRADVVRRELQVDGVVGALDQVQHALRGQAPGILPVTGLDPRGHPPPDADQMDAHRQTDRAPR